jgi:hypothetical protein
MCISKMTKDHRLRIELLKKFYKEASSYFNQEKIRKEKLRNIISINEYYRREIQRNKIKI